GAATFTTDAPDSNRIGFFAIDGAGLAANNGNYVFAQDAANASALLITPQTDPEVPSGAPSSAIGAVTTALQTEGVCSNVDDASVAPCRGAADVPQRTVRVANHATPVAGASFGREGAGIRLPAGASDQ